MPNEQGFQEADDEEVSWQVPPRRQEETSGPSCESGLPVPPDEDLQSPFLGSPGVMTQVKRLDEETSLPPTESTALDREGSVDAGATSSRASTTPVIETFRATIERSGNTKLGISIDDSDGVSLVVMMLKPGLIYDWNVKSGCDSSDYILPGCRIVEVNGIRNDADKMYSCAMEERTLHLVLERIVDDAKVCQTNDSEVLVHVYDLGGMQSRAVSRLNRMTTRFGLFHTGIEVYGREWYFSGGEHWFDGVYSMPQPKVHPKHKYRRTISMGDTRLDAATFEELFASIRLRWPAWSYHVFNRNCHTFVDHVCKVLGFDAGPSVGICGSGDKTLASTQTSSSWFCCGHSHVANRGDGTQINAPFRHADWSFRPNSLEDDAGLEGSDALSAATADRAQAASQKTKKQSDASSAFCDITSDCG